jgi:Histidine kinase
MPPMPTLAPSTRPVSNRRLWLAYGLLCVLAWLLYAVAGTDWQRGTRTFWEGLYEATWSLGPGLVLGPLVFPWTRWTHDRLPGPLPRLAWHGVAAVVFVMLWQGLVFAWAGLLFGLPHARATFEQGVVWRAAWGVVVYSALVFGFGGALLARRAHRQALRAAEAESALVRAELAAVQGKLNPHFLFNTLNSLLMLTRRDPARAEAGLLGFSRLMRYVLECTRQGSGRVALRDELAFVRDYLQLEQLRLGERLRVVWELDPGADDDELPPLTLQPLVENAVAHGIAPRVQGGTLRIGSRRSAQGLHLHVGDDGAGCDWPPQPGTQRGIGLAALQRRFELDYDGRARFEVSSAPGQGFAVDILIP